MVLNVPIPDDVADRLTAMARRTGVSLEDYAILLLEASLKRKSFDELSCPAAEAFEQSGMSEDDFEILIDEVKHEVRAERRLRRGA